MSDLSPGDDALELARLLISIDSVSPSLVPGAPGEGRIAAVIAQRLEGAGFLVDLIPAQEDPQRVSVVAVHEGSRPGPTVVFNGHLDTVGVEGMADPFNARIADGKLFGRGASDMKSGLAGLIVAAERLAAADHPGTVVFTGVADEEDASVGAAAVLRHLADRGVTADVCLIAEPTWLDRVSAHRGYAVVEVTLQGTAAHSSQPGLAVDAIRALGALLHEVARADDELRRRPAHPLLEYGSFTATVVRAGSAPFTIAADATLVIERRTLPGERAEDALVEVQAMLDAVVARMPGLRTSARLTHQREAWEADEQGAAARFADALAAEFSRDAEALPAAVGAPYWMESALWQAAGIPTVVCGPAGGGLHAAEEWVDLDQLRRFPEAVVAATRDALSGSSEA
ncbi:M20/M25/M40 family metallo-hydrolase [Plantibacter sp. CFBP 13570]|uniref:M20/M25/M40 family metallo-hydrolase n=1 Tax=Plantibacter sp. CFBP 13570 TaxID=2775272 RepID=UPI001930B121|nr:M20/M25/M40 family metallo-hydrolase [Plantibacter sp. CFBP 13570]MBD8536980.1 M20/M25/M40 family metallo-hydrolase [Plantibacter sp. CFBP 13570]